MSHYSIGEERTSTVCLFDVEYVEHGCDCGKLQRLTDVVTNSNSVGTESNSDKCECEWSSI